LLLIGPKRIDRCTLISKIKLLHRSSESKTIPFEYPTQSNDGQIFCYPLQANYETPVFLLICYHILFYYIILYSMCVIHIVVVKTKIVPQKRTSHEQLGQQLVQELSGLINKIKQRPTGSHELTCLTSDDQIEILSACLDKPVIAWIWCRSQIAFENLRPLADQRNLVKLLTCLEKTARSTTMTGTRSEIIRRHHIDVDIDQFRKALGK